MLQNISKKKHDSWRKCNIKIFCHPNGNPRRYITYELANSIISELLQKSDLSSTESETSEEYARLRYKKKSYTAKSKTKKFFGINPLQALSSNDTSEYNSNNALAYDINFSSEFGTNVNNLNSEENVQSGPSAYSSPYLQNRIPIAEKMIQESFQEDGQTETTLRNTIIDNSNDTAPGPTNADLLEAIKNLTKTVVHLQNSVDLVHQQLVNLEFANVVNDEMTDHSLDIPKLPCYTIHEIKAVETYTNIPGNFDQSSILSRRGYSRGIN